MNIPEELREKAFRLSHLANNVMTDEEFADWEKICTLSGRLKPSRNFPCRAMYEHKDIYEQDEHGKYKLKGSSGILWFT